MTKTFDYQYNMVAEKLHSTVVVKYLPADIGSVVDEDWQKFVDEKKIEELEHIIKDENLNRDAAYTFVKNAFRDGGVISTGTAISKILPPVSRFSKDGVRTSKRESVLDKLTRFFEKYFDISGGKFCE